VRLPSLVKTRIDCILDRAGLVLGNLPEGIFPTSPPAFLFIPRYISSTRKRTRKQCSESIFSLKGCQIVATKSKLARGSGRQHKAWGGAQRNPRNRGMKTAARGSGRQPDHDKRCRPLRGLGCVWAVNLGFHFVSPQALCCRPLV